MLLCVEAYSLSSFPQEESSLRGLSVSPSCSSGEWERKRREEGEGGRREGQWMNEQEEGGEGRRREGGKRREKEGGREGGREGEGGREKGGRYWEG